MNKDNVIKQPFNLAGKIGDEGRFSCIDFLDGKGVVNYEEHAQIVEILSAYIDRLLTMKAITHQKISMWMYKEQSTPEAFLKALDAGTYGDAVPTGWRWDHNAKGFRKPHGAPPG